MEARTAALLGARYRLDASMSSGRYATIYRAYDGERTATVAIKQFTERIVNPALHERAMAQFYAEFEMLSQASHPNLPRVVAYHENGKEPFYVMEFEETVTLEAVARAAMPAEHVVLNWLAQLLNVLSYLHAHRPPLVYRNLEPRRIRITADGKIKLMDFELLALVAPGERRTMFRGVGAPEYAPVEQLNQTRSDPQMDVYALGATLYFLLTLTPPPPSVDRLTQGTPVRPIREIRPIPAELELAIEAMMALNVNQRPQSMAQVASMLGPMIQSTRSYPIPAPLWAALAPLESQPIAPAMPAPAPPPPERPAEPVPPRSGGGRRLFTPPAPQAGPAAAEKPRNQSSRLSILDVLHKAVARGASDIHIKVGLPPMIRYLGKTMPLGDYPVLSASDAKALVYNILSDEQKSKFESALELDSSYNVPGVSRFRLNVHLEYEGVGAAIRVIPSLIPRPENLGLSAEVRGLCDLPSGLVLVTGAAGSGKSTTLASLVQSIALTHESHILTIEDPVEFIFQDGNGIVTQREVGRQTHSFADALRAGLRQDPDVILVGEMRDLETIALALTAAETGHLVFASLHTTTAAHTVERVVDVFPAAQQQQIRIQLAGTLRAVIRQILLPRANGEGRVAAREVLLSTPGIAHLIREGKTHQIPAAIETGAKIGMVPLDRALADLIVDGSVTLENALSRADDVEAIKSYLAGHEAIRSRSSW